MHPRRFWKAVTPVRPSFSLLHGVTLYGGFVGDETMLDARNMYSHVTTLSGDLGILDDNFDNANTVVYCGEYIEAAIDGISISGGNAKGFYDYEHPYKQSGGGIFADYGSSLTVTNCRISNNLANASGGGIYNCGTLTVTNSTFSGNAATDDYSDGGGIYNDYNGTLTVTNCTLAGNSAGYSGDGIYSSSGALTLNNSLLCFNSGRNIEGSYTGSYNLIDFDPDFVRAPSAGADGNWGTSDDDPGDLRLSDRSLAINAGSNLLALDAVGDPLAIDLSNNPRIADGTVDIGAYEYQGPPAPGRETPSLVVSSPGDVFDVYDGGVTLREAIFYSQSGIGGDTITFDSALDGATITLAGSELSDRACDRD